MSISYRKYVTPEKRRFAVKMRRSPTVAERILWEHFKKRGIGCRVRRQVVMFGWIVDFYCPSKKLIIEVDGEYHNNPEQRKKDEYRDQIFLSKGIKTLRFSNAEVFTKKEYVLARIREFQ